ncbi:hypothetical protein, partial [Streptomyces sp. AC627_RSS907]|uniref:hypothetical protein n=1 Tax=Streptomyces sp. AC627_RSS907 TaxID=2823684 RepID=UPI0027E4CBCB
MPLILSRKRPEHISNELEPSAGTARAGGTVDMLAPALGCGCANHQQHASDHAPRAAPPPVIRSLRPSLARATTAATPTS